MVRQNFNYFYFNGSRVVLGHVLASAGDGRYTASAIASFIDRSLMQMGMLSCGTCRMPHLQRALVRMMMLSMQGKPGRLDDLSGKMKRLRRNSAHPITELHNKKSTTCLGRQMGSGSW